MINRMAKKAPPATTAVALIANTTLQPSSIVPRDKTTPAGATRRPLLGRSKAGGPEAIRQRARGRRGSYEGQILKTRWISASASGISR
jgi:hypothetical protein